MLAEIKTLEKWLNFIIIFEVSLNNLFWQKNAHRSFYLSIKKLEYSDFWFADSNSFVEFDFHRK
jgi:hypothetical protein